MLTRNRYIPLAMFLAIIAMIAAVACGSTETVEVTRVVEVEREVEVPVTQVVTEQVEVTKVVTQEVVVTEEVIVTEEVEVTKIIEVEVEAPEGPKDTIVFSDLNWTSAQVQNRIAQYIIEHGYGYPTDVVFGGTLPLFQGLRGGDTHVTMEIWLPNQSEAWDEALANGEVVPVGASLGSDWQSTFVIPAYLQEEYPELDHIDDLKDPQFQELFSTDDSRGKARLVACVPGWSCELVNDAQITGYELEEYLHVIKPGSQDAMFAEVFGAYEQNEPWLGYMWGTADPALLLDLVLLEETPYSDECWFTTKACAFEDASILIAVHPALPSRAPDVIDFLRNWEFNISVYKAVAQWTDQNDANAGEAALNWLKEEGDTWSTWVTPEAATAVQAALDSGLEAEGWPDE